MTAPGTQAPPSSYGRGHRALEIASIAFVFVALLWLGYRITAAPSTRWSWLYITLSIVSGYVLSDFLSGFVHWAGDTIGDETTPVFGPNFVHPFRYHHVDPKDITRHDFVETNGNNCIVAAPVLLLVMLLLPSAPGPLFYGCVLGASTFWFVFCTNQFHKWAHMEAPPRWVRLLQRAGLVLSPEHHAIHHAAPQNKYYCITVGWMNPVLERIRFFPICEAVVSRILPGALRPDGRSLTS
jgi:ubiquitin-conjugating enzyme E2 variant